MVVVTAVSHRIGDDVAAGGGIFREVEANTVFGRVLRRSVGLLRRTADSTHLAGRLHIAIEPLTVVTAVSHRIGDDVAAGGGIFREVDANTVFGRVLRRTVGLLRRRADSTHLAGRLNINIHPLAVVTAVSYRTGDGVAALGDFFREVVANAVVGVW